MKHFDFTYCSKTEQVKLHLSENHWWWDFVFTLAETVCALTRHTRCSFFVGPAFDLCDRHTHHKLTVPATREQWVEWAKVTGQDDPSWWWEDDDD